MKKIALLALFAGTPLMSQHIGTLPKLAIEATNLGVSYANNTYIEPNVTGSFGADFLCGALKPALMGASIFCAAKLCKIPKPETVAAVACGASALNAIWKYADQLRATYSRPRTTAALAWEEHAVDNFPLFTSLKNKLWSDPLLDGQATPRAIRLLGSLCGFAGVCYMINKSSISLPEYLKLL